METSSGREAYGDRVEWLGFGMAIMKTSEVLLIIQSLNMENKTHMYSRVKNLRQ
jgi:hypothetical protein